MGFKEEITKKDICNRALEIINTCAEWQLSDENTNELEMTIAQTAKIWCDIYEKLKIKEIEM